MHAVVVAADFASHMPSTSRERNEKCTHLPMLVYVMEQSVVLCNGLVFMSQSCQRTQVRYVTFHTLRLQTARVSLDLFL